MSSFSNDQIKNSFGPEKLHTIMSYFIVILFPLWTKLFNNSLLGHFIKNNSMSGQFVGFYSVFGHKMSQQRIDNDSNKLLFVSHR